MKKNKTTIEDLYPDVVATANGSGMPIVFEVFCIYIGSGLWTNEFAFWLADQAGIPVVSCPSDSYFVTFWRLIKLQVATSYKRPGISGPANRASSSDRLSRAEDTHKYRPTSYSLLTPRTLESLRSTNIPSLPKMSNIGPALPPHLQKKRAATPESEPESGPQPKARSRSPSPDQAGPALPPHILAARRAKAQAQASASSSSSSLAPVTSASVESKKTYGPTLPGSVAPVTAAATAPTLAPALPPRPAYAGYEDDADDDDDVGPRPEMAYRGDQPGDAVREFLEREERVNKLREVRHDLVLDCFLFDLGSK
jgi:hypothetical protein